MRRLGFLLLCALFVPLEASSAEEGAQLSSGRDVQFVRMSYERLPDMTIPRFTHIMFTHGDEIVVIGGHTTGFLLTSTAEYYHGGKWTSIPTVYPHDDASSVLASDGKVYVFGGHNDYIGIGQSFSVEVYDPDSHSFNPVPIMDTKRALCRSTELADGRIVVSGNWYKEDDIEIYDRKTGGEVVKESSNQRSLPYILRTSGDNAIIFGSQDNYGKEISPVIVDRLNGDPYHVPLLDEWRVRPLGGDLRSADFFVGDMESGDYTYLVPAWNADGQVAILKVADGEFSLLETECDVPMEGPMGSISYHGGFFADRKTGAAFLTGIGEDGSACVLRIDYRQALEGGKASLMLYHTEAIEDFLIGSATMSEDGRIIVSGGIGADYMNPSAAVFVLSPGLPGRRALSIPWVPLAGALMLILAVAASFYWYRKKRQAAGADDADDAADSGDYILDDARADELMAQISELMESRQLYLQPRLKVSDLVTVLGTNSQYISYCINRKTGGSFTDFVNDYRIRYAQKVLKENPDIKMLDLAERAGFSSDVSFFRNFKLRTDLTPSQWLDSQ